MTEDDSSETAQSSGSSSGDSSPLSFLDEDAWALVRRYYHIPALVFVFSFMVAVRAQTAGRFITDSGIFFSGNDPWYHYRQVAYTVKHWPFTMPFDPWTGYPTGASTNHFGTLYDQILATVALILGLGSPSDELVRKVMVYAPPFIGALTAIPVYAVAKRITSRGGGVLAAVLLALMPGVFLSRGLAGVADHNIAEPLFMTLGVAATLYALDRAVDEVVVYELVANRDFDALRGWLVASVVAGLAIASYIHVWPPAILLVGILGIAYLAYALVVQSSAAPGEPVLLTGGVSMFVTALAVLPFVEKMGLSTTTLSLAQVGVPAAIGLGCLFLTWLDRNKDSLPNFGYGKNVTYVSTVLALVVASVALIRVAAPSAYNMVVNNAVRTIGLGTHAATQTIGEAKPFVQSSDQIFSAMFGQYGSAFVVGLIGAVWMLFVGVQKLRDDESPHSEVVLLVWLTIVTLAAFTQVRFNYYLAPVVCIFAAYGAYKLVTLELMGDSIAKSFPRNLQAYQWMALGAIFIILCTGLVVPASTSAPERAQYNGVGGYSQWHGTLDWMSEETPEIDSLEYYGTYERQSDYNYSDDAYGVMSWWDYGHWTTVTGERIPVANPFQHHATEAAQYLLSDTESGAQDVAANLSDDGEDNVRYVMVDWKMVEPTSKFMAPVVWNPDTNRSDMIKPIYRQNADGRVSYAFGARQQRFYESLMVRMYYFHGSQANPGPVVVDWTNQQVDTASGGVTVPMTPSSDPQSNKKYAVRWFNSTSDAREYVKNDSTSQLGGIGMYPEEQVDALEHYRLVKTSKSMAIQSRSYKNALSRVARQSDQKVGLKDFNPAPSWVKVFERVDGATVKGTNAQPNATVTAVVRMQSKTNGLKFTYRQTAQADANGNWSMTLPYSTTGYDNHTTEDGYTNVSVRSAGPYTFFSSQSSATVSAENGTQVSVDRRVAKSHVTEQQVVTEGEEPLTVALQKVQTENSDNSSDDSK